MGRKLSDATFAAEMVALFGVAHTATLLGWAAVAVVYGANDQAAFVEMPFGGRSTRYKRLADFKRLAAHLRDLGYDLGDAELTVAPVRVLAG